MEVTYKYDVTHGSLVIRPDGEVDTRAYPLRMVLGNQIPGLLPCRLQKADGNVFLYYEITALQKVFDVYEKLSYEELKSIYLGLLKVFEQMDAYLLDAGHLILEPEYIYLDKGDSRICLCYLPGPGRPIREQLRSFTEYLLPRIEHQDQRGVRLGYGLYRLLMEEDLQMDAIGALIRKSEEEEKEKDVRPSEDDQGGEKMHKEAREAPERGHGRYREIRKDLVLLLAGVLLIGGFVVVRRLGYLGDISLPMLLIFLFCGILLAALVVWNGKRKGHEREKEDRGAWENDEYREDDERQENEGELSKGEESVILCRPSGSEHPMLVCEENGQAPPIILNREMIVVGKMDGVSDVLLDWPAISRVQARIQKREEGYWIADLNSRNGTFVNGRRLEKEEEHLLQSEDQVTFADISYRFDI